MVGAMLLSPLLLPHTLFYLFSPKKQLIRSDVGGGWRIFVYRLIYDQPFRNVFYYRIGRIHVLFSWLFKRYPTTKIKQDMTIGRNIVFVHAYNTFLNAQSIGDYFTCFHNVTIGQKGGKIPTIGNHVTVSCGATIVGDVHVGNNVIIGCGCVVTKDVPDNCTVIGNPAKIIRKKD